MNRMIKYGLLTLSSITFATTVTTSQSHAAAWHYGTPKILRGTYKVTRHVGGKYAFSYKEGVQLTRRTYMAFGLGDPFSLNRVSYKRYGRYTYLLRGVEYVYSHKWNYVKLRATHYKLKERVTYPYPEKHFSRVYYR